MWSAWEWVKSDGVDPRQAEAERLRPQVGRRVDEHDPLPHLQLQPRPPAACSSGLSEVQTAAGAADHRDPGRGAAAEHGDAQRHGTGEFSAATPPRPAAEPGIQQPHLAARPPARPAARGSARAAARRTPRPAAARRSARMAASGRAARCLKLVCESRRSVEWTSRCASAPGMVADQEADRRALRQPAPEAVLPVAVVQPVAVDREIADAPRPRRRSPARRGRRRRRRGCRRGRSRGSPRRTRPRPPARAGPAGRRPRRGCRRSRSS